MDCSLATFYGHKAMKPQTKEASRLCKGLHLHGSSQGFVPLSISLKVHHCCKPLDVKHLEYFLCMLCPRMLNSTHCSSNQDHFTSLLTIPKLLCVYDHQSLHQVVASLLKVQVITLQNYILCDLCATHFLQYPYLNHCCEIIGKFYNSLVLVRTGNQIDYISLFLPKKAIHINHKLKTVISHVNIVISFFPQYSKLLVKSQA